jgi:hypothetical protein
VKKLRAAELADIEAAVGKVAAGKIWTFFGGEELENNWTDDKR